MDESEIKARIAEGDAHFNRGEWDEAIACYQTVLEAHGNPQLTDLAAQGVQQAQIQKEVEAQIREEIAQARAALAQGDYKRVISLCNQAQTRGAQNHILTYHAEADALRDEAQERERWSKRVQDVMAEVGRLEEARAVRRALEVLKALLDELKAAGLEDLGRPAHEAWVRLQEVGQKEEQLEEVDRLYQAQDFRVAYALVERLNERWREDPDVSRWYARVRFVWEGIQQRLADADSALAEGRLEDAVGILGRLGNEFPQNPDWKAAWLKAYMDHGRAQVEAGRRAFQEQRFKDAGAAFEAGRDDFARVKEVFDKHPSADLARDEAEALRQVADLAERARQDTEARRLDRWEMARASVTDALTQLRVAVQVRGHDFGDVASTLHHMLDRINESINGLNEAGAALAAGNTFLEERKPDKAEAEYRKGLALAQDRDDDLVKKLVAGLSRADQAQSDVRVLLNRADELSDPAERLAPLQAAYDRWPGAPDMPHRLTETLLQAAQQALQGRDEKMAADYCARLLAISEAPADHRQRAEEILGELECKNQVEGMLAQADRQQAQISAAKQPDEAAYRQLVNTLERAREYAGQEKCRRAWLGVVQSRLQAAREKLARVERAAPLLAQAESLHEQGEWRTASERLAQAIETLGDLPAPELQERLQQWQAIAEAIEQSLRAASEAVQQAEEYYQAARNGDLRAVRWVELNRSLGIAGSALSAPPSGADRLPAAWDALRGRVEDLTRRSAILRGAHDDILAGQKRDARVRLEKALSPEGGISDPVLNAVLRRLVEELKEEDEARTRELIDEIHDHIARGERSEALKKLAEAQQLRVTQAAKELKALERQIAVWNEIERGLLDAMAKRNSDSPSEALAAFRDTLQKATDPDSGLAKEVREDLAKLLGLEKGLHLDDTEKQAEAIYASLAAGASQNRLVQALLVPLRAWLDLAIPNARQGFLRSRIALEKYVEGYEQALRDVERFPNDPSFEQIATKARQGILSQLRESVRKRVGRAMTLRDAGAFAEAKAELEQISDEFLKYVEQHFPEVLRDEELDRLRDQAADLRSELAILHELSDRLAPLVGKVQEAYAEGDLARATRMLTDAKLADPDRRVRLLWKQFDEVEHLIERSQQEADQTVVRQALKQAEIALGLSRSPDDVRAIIRDLDAIYPAVERLTGAQGEALRQSYRQMMAKAQTRVEELEGVEQAILTAKEAADRGAYGEQLAALERAAAAATGREREKILAEITRLRPKVEREQQASRAWHEALVAFEAGDFEATQRALATAKAHGWPEAEIIPYQQAVRVGLLVRQAAGLLHGSGDPIKAASLLEQALALATDCRPATALRVEAEVYLRQAKNQQEQRAAAEREAAARRQKIAGLLREAQAAFRQGNLGTARSKLEEVFALDPEAEDAEEAANLKNQLDRSEQVAWLLGQAREQRGKGQYDEALRSVMRVLEELEPKSSEARLLHDQLIAEREAEQAIARARGFIEDNQFEKARTELEKARDRNPSHPKLTAAQEELRAAEERFRNRALNPLKEALRNKDFRLALAECDRLLEQISLPEFRAEVQRYQQTAIDQWASLVIGQATALLEKQETPLEQLTAVRTVLGEIVAHKPAPAGRTGEEARSLIQRIETERLRRRLAEAQRALADGRAAAAEWHQALKADQEAIAQERKALAFRQSALAAAIGDEVEQAAQEQRLVALGFEAGRFNASIKAEERRWNEEEERIIRARVKATRDEMLAQARQHLAATNAPLPPDAVRTILETGKLASLDEARRLVDQVLALPGFNDDSEALQLRATCEEAARRLTNTVEALKAARRRLASRAYRLAREKLEEADDLSPALQGEVLRVIALAAELQGADESEAEDPRAALAIYAKAVESDPDLAISLNSAINRCRATLMDQTIAQVEVMLNAPIPDYESALARLQAAVQAGWVLPERRRQVASLEGRARGLQLTAQAARLLAEGGNPKDALDILNQVRDQMGDAALDATTEGWIAVAQMALILQTPTLETTDLSEAKAWCDKIPVAWADRPPVKDLIADLNGRQALAAALKEAEDRVQTALEGSPPDFSAAVQAARNARELSVPPHDRAVALTTDVQQRLLREITILRGREDYAGARQMCRYLDMLLPEDELPGQLQMQIEQERQERLNQALRQVEQALADDLPVEATRQLARAEKLAGEEGDERLALLQARLMKRRDELQQVEALVDASRVALAARDLTVAVANARRAIGLASRYEPVRLLVADLRQELEGEIRRAMATGEFSSARRTCDLALELDSVEPFLSLKDHILAEQRRIAATAYEQACAALLVFDLAGAEQALAMGRKANDGDRRFNEIEVRLDNARQLAPELRQMLEIGWSQLQARDLEKAKATFQAAAARTQDFEEPRLWLSYTGNLLDGIAQALREQHESAVHRFEAAENALRLRTDERLSPLWGDRLRIERRRAVYYAWRLRSELGDMLAERQRARQLGENGDPLAATELLRKLIDRQRRLPDLVKTQLEPPPDFDATTASVSADLSVKSRTAAPGPSAEGVSPVPWATQEVKPVPPVAPPPQEIEPTLPVVSPEPDVSPEPPVAPPKPEQVAPGAGAPDKAQPTTPAPSEAGDTSQAVGSSKQPARPTHGSVWTDPGQSIPASLFEDWPSVPPETPSQEQ